VAPNAAVIGSVTLQHKASVFYGAVVRGDLNDVTIGAFTTVGDRAVITTTKSVEGHVSAGVRIGNHVTIGPGALLQSCTIQDGAVIGGCAWLHQYTHIRTAALPPPVAPHATCPGAPSLPPSRLHRDCAGAGAMVLEGALVEATARVGEGAVVHAGRRIPAGQLWAGACINGAAVAGPVVCTPVPLLYRVPDRACGGGRCIPS